MINTPKEQNTIGDEIDELFKAPIDVSTRNMDRDEILYGYQYLNTHKNGDSALSYRQKLNLRFVFQDKENMPPLHLIKKWTSEGKVIHKESHYMTDSPSRLKDVNGFYVYDEKTLEGNFYNSKGEVIPWNIIEGINGEQKISRVDYPRLAKEGIGKGGTQPQKGLPLQGYFFQQTEDGNWTLFSKSIIYDKDTKEYNLHFIPAQIQISKSWDSKTTAETSPIEVIVGKSFQSIFGLNGNFGNPAVFDTKGNIYELFTQTTPELEPNLDMIGGNLEHYKMYRVSPVFTSLNEISAEDFQLIQKAMLFSPKNVQILGEKMTADDILAAVEKTKKHIQNNIEFAPPFTTKEEVKEFLLSFNPYFRSTGENLEELLGYRGVKSKVITYFIEDGIYRRLVVTDNYGAYVVGCNAQEIDIFSFISDKKQISTPPVIQQSGYYNSLDEATKTLREILFPQKLLTKTNQELIDILKQVDTGVLDGGLNGKTIDEKISSVLVLEERGFNRDLIIKIIYPVELRITILEILGDENRIEAAKVLGLSEHKDITKSSKNFIKKCYIMYEKLKKYHAMIGDMKSPLLADILEALKNNEKIFASGANYNNGIELYCEFILIHLQSIDFQHDYKNNINKRNFGHTKKLIREILAIMTEIINSDNNDLFFLRSESHNIVEYKGYLQYCISQIEERCQYLTERFKKERNV